MTTPRARPAPAVGASPGYARLGAIGHFGVALGYLLGVIVLLRGVDAVLPALIVYGASTLALGVGCCSRARPSAASPSLSASCCC
ncbi:MAG: hypothetical protein U1F43_31665 [Myxococcota bacterium]